MARVWNWVIRSRAQFLANFERRDALQYLFKGALNVIFF